MASGSARDFGKQLVHYLRKTVNFNDPGIGSAGIRIGRLPQNAFVGQCFVRVETPFNAATTNVLTVGTNSPTFNNIAAAADITEGSAQTQIINTGAGLGSAFTDDTDVIALYTQTGTPASAGKATIIVAYAVGE